MSSDDTEEEKFFRERYAQELQKKKWQLGARSYSQGDEMAEERRNVSCYIMIMLFVILTVMIGVSAATVPMRSANAAKVI